MSSQLGPQLNHNGNCIAPPLSVYFTVINILDHDLTPCNSFLDLIMLYLSSSIASMLNIDTDNIRYSFRLAIKMVAEPEEG